MSHDLEVTSPANQNPNFHKCGVTGRDYLVLSRFVRQSRCHQPTTRAARHCNMYCACHRSAGSHDPTITRACSVPIMLEHNPRISTRTADPLVAHQKKACGHSPSAGETPRATDQPKTTSVERSLEKVWESAESAPGAHPGGSALISSHKVRIGRLVVPAKKVFGCL